MRADRGVSLIELLMATAVALVVLLAIGNVDVTRILFLKDLTQAVPQTSEAAFALAHMIRSLQQADRINLISASNIQLRIPQASGGSLNPTNANYDLPGNYRWVQYKLVPPVSPNTIQFYDNTALDCTPDWSAGGPANPLTDLTIGYQNEAPAPPGGDPAIPSPPVPPLGADNNVLLIRISWPNANSPPPTLSYTGEVTIRSGAYTQTMTGLAPAGIADPAPAGGC